MNIKKLFIKLAPIVPIIVMGLSSISANAGGWLGENNLNAFNPRWLEGEDYYEATGNSTNYCADDEQILTMNNWLANREDVVLISPMYKVADNDKAMAQKFLELANDDNNYFDCKASMNDDNICVWVVRSKAEQYLADEEYLEERKWAMFNSPDCVFFTTNPDTIEGKEIPTGEGTVTEDGRVYVDETELEYTEEGYYIDDFTINNKDIPHGTVVITSICPDEMLEKYSATNGVINVINTDRNAFYQIELQPINDFGTTVTLPNGNYVIDSVFVGMDYTPTTYVETSGEDTNFTVYVDNTERIRITFNQNDIGKSTLEKEEENGIGIVPNDEATTKKSPVATIMQIAIGISCPLVLVIVGVVIFLVIKKKNSNQSM